MDYEQELQDIKDEFNKTISSLESRIAELSRLVSVHQHNGYDMTTPLDSSLKLKDQSFITIGNSQVSAITQNPGSTNEVNSYLIGCGIDRGVGFSDTGKNTQLTLQNLQGTTGGTNLSFFYGQRPPIYITHQGSVVGITSGTATLTDTTKKWSTSGSGELVGALVNVYDSAGTFKETRTVVSNTATVITVNSNWSYTDASSTYIVFVPVYLGSADYPWKRIYADEGTAGGVRFGAGPTAGGQNGLLYMDATGDLYWRGKGGASTKLN